MHSGHSITGFLQGANSPYPQWDPSFPSPASHCGEANPRVWITPRQQARRYLSAAGMVCGLTGDRQHRFEKIELDARHWLKAPGDGLRQLRGAFALAVLDPKTGQALLAVDRFAIENLYYLATPAGLAFASRAGLLANHPQVAHRFRLQSLYDALYFHCLPGPEAGYVGMSRLLPGHYLRWQAGHWETARYANADATDDATDTPATEEALAEALRQGLKGAVAQALPHDAPACFLSGGLDSSTVTGLCAALRPADTVACTIGFAADGYDEMAFAANAARHFGVRHLQHYLTAEQVVEDLPTIISAFDAPFGNASALPTYACAKLAAAAGHSTILAGDGGDEIFGGNQRYAHQQTLEHYRHVPLWLRKAVIAPIAQALPAALNRGFAAKATSYLRQAAMPLPERLMSWNLLNRIAPASFLTPSMLAEIDLEAPLAHLRRSYARTEGQHTVDRLLQLDWQLTLADSDLPKVSRACALAGIEVAFPMLDDAVVALARRLPPRWKVGARELRPFYRRSFATFLPSATLQKSKQGFGMPVGPWLAGHPGLREFAVEQLTWLEGLGLLRRGFRDELMGRQVAEHPAYYGSLVWVLMTLGLWLRQTHVTLVS